MSLCPIQGLTNMDFESQIRFLKCRFFGFSVVKSAVVPESILDWTVAHFSKIDIEWELRVCELVPQIAAHLISCSKY